MTLAEIALLFAIAGNSASVVIAAWKIIAWISSVQTELGTLKTRLDSLEREVHNDVAGRRVVADIREDVATIKAQIGDMKSDLRVLFKKIGDEV